MNKTTLYATLVFLISTYFFAWLLIGMIIEKIKNLKFLKDKVLDDSGIKLKVETKLQNQIGGIIEVKHIS